ncbi:AraC family transcriptional regulator [Rhodovibrionaceae bacterium A322]
MSSDQPLLQDREVRSSSLKDREVRPPSDDRPLPSARNPVVGFAKDMPSGRVIEWHNHEHCQLLYAASGLMRVHTTQGVWGVPPQRAVWIPVGVDHQVEHLGDVDFRTLYLSPDLPDLPQSCGVLVVGSLLRELIVAVTRLPRDYPPQGTEARLIQVLVDQIALAPEAGLHLPLSDEKRLQPLITALLADPSDPRGLDDWAKDCAASSRTLARLFEKELGLGFRQWRQQLRLQDALARLAAGEAITSVALSVGYDSPSAFIAMFKRELGASPGRYLEGEQ